MRPRRFVVVALFVLMLMATLNTGMLYGRRYQINTMCCLVPRSRNLVLTAKDLLGLSKYYGQLGQDRWVLNTVFPDVVDGFFLDVGSWDGTIASNSKALEARGWKGICIDPFPQNMDGRSCQMLKEVVAETSGRKVVFRQAGAYGGVDQSMTTTFKKDAAQSSTIELTTVTLAELLDRVKAPKFIHYMSLDIEGGEWNALQGFPWDRYKLGAFTIERNYDPETMYSFLESKGYHRVFSWYHDDYFVPRDSPHQVWDGHWR